MQIEIMQNSDNKREKNISRLKNRNRKFFQFSSAANIVGIFTKKKKKTYFAYSLKAFSPIEPEEEQTYGVTSSSSIILHRYSVPVPDSN